MMIHCNSKKASMRAEHFLYFSSSRIYRRMAENEFAPLLGNFADISYLVEN